MEVVKALEKKVILCAIVLAMLLMAGIGIFVEGYLPYVLGLLFGLSIGILNFLQLSRTIMRAVYLQPHKAQSFTRRRYFVRFIIYGLVLWISIKSSSLNVLGTIVGILLIKFSIFSTQLFNDKSYFLNIFKRKEAEED